MLLLMLQGSDRPRSSKIFHRVKRRSFDENLMARINVTLEKYDFLDVYI